jgi:hypothetical protein
MATRVCICSSVVCRVLTAALLAAALETTAGGELSLMPLLRDGGGGEEGKIRFWPDPTPVGVLTPA